MNEKQLREKRQNVWSQMQEILAVAERDGNRELTAEERSKWDAADAELTGLTGDIERAERASKLDAEFRKIDDQRVVVTPDGERANGQETGKYERAFAGWLRHGMERLDAEQRDLLQANFRAQAVGTGSAGGYTVPQGFWAKVTETMKYFGGMLDVAEVIDTTTGEALPWPTNDDTSNTGALLAENTQISEQDLTFGQKNLGAYTYTSKLIRVSLQLLRDTGIDVESFIARKVGQRLGRIYNTHLTTGTGSSQPQGVITGASTGKTTAGATAITYDELVDLIHSVDVAYRSAGNCRFMFNDLVAAYVRKIRDDSGGSGLGRPIWEPNVQVGQPSLLLGYPVSINNDMDSTVAATKKTMLFGDIRSMYVARRVGAGQVMRLTERYADYLQVGFFGFGDLDGLVQDASAAKLLVQHA